MIEICELQLSSRILEERCGEGKGVPDCSEIKLIILVTRRPQISVFFELDQLQS